MKACHVSTPYVSCASSLNEAKRTLAHLLEGVTKSNTTDLEPYYKKSPKPQESKETDRAKTSNGEDEEEMEQYSLKQNRSFLGLKATLSHGHFKRVLKPIGKLRKVPDLSHVFVSEFVTKEEGRILKQLRDEKRGTYSSKEGNLINLGGMNFDITKGNY